MIKKNSSWSSVILLTLLYVVNFADRTILNILFTPIKEEFLLSDFELAFLSSTSFTFFYATLGIILGRYADRYKRTILIAIGAIIWSIATLLIGFADSFLFIAICRICVGIGQSFFFPSAISLLSEIVSSERRGAVMGFFSTAIAIGIGISFIIGGAIVSESGWRTVMIIAGLPGIILGAITFFASEPERNNISAGNKINLRSSWNEYKKHKLIFIHSIGYGFFAVSSTSINVWLPTYFQRVFALSVKDSAILVGSMVLFVGVPAIILSGMASDFARRKFRGGRMYLSSYLAALSIIFWLIMLMSSNYYVQLIALPILVLTGFSWYGAAISDIVEIVPISIVAFASGVYIFFVTLFNSAISPLVYGYMNDLLFKIYPNGEGIRLTLFLSPISAFIGAVLLFYGSKKMNLQQSQNNISN